MRFLGIICVLLAGLLLEQKAWAQTTPAPAPPPPPVPQVSPQLNTPGPQLNIPQPTNPAQQSAPITSTPPAATEPSTAPTRQTRERPRRQREADRTKEPSHRRTAQQGASCSYNRCVQRCMDTSQAFFIVGLRTGSSCQDQCKHKGCSDRDPLRMYIDP